MPIAGASGIPCARYEGGEDEARVAEVLAFALGLIGTKGILKTARDRIARVYDYKGELIIATRSTLPLEWQEAFKRSWEEVGYEYGGNVRFLDVKSEDWQTYWSSRRFESDWAA